MSELKTRNSKLKTARAAQGERTEDDYVIEAALKVLEVFFALEGSQLEPVSIQRVVQRLSHLKDEEGRPLFNRSFVRSALITLKKAGAAKQQLDTKESLFVFGPRVENLAKRYAKSLL